MAPRYEPALEAKWQKIWEERGLFNAPEDPARPSTTCWKCSPTLPGASTWATCAIIPSGRGGPVQADAGFQRAPSHGLGRLRAAGGECRHGPGAPPGAWTYDNIEYMRRQLRNWLQLRLARELATCDPDYYRWEQLVFIEMFAGAGLQERGPVNWCPKCQTVLANEQVEEGLCWRCDSPVHLKELNQWLFKITNYAEELLADLDS